MKKFRMDLDALAVESFSTGEAAMPIGTVRANSYAGVEEPPTQFNCSEACLYTSVQNCGNTGGRYTCDPNCIGTYAPANTCYVGCGTMMQCQGTYFPCPNSALPDYCPGPSTGGG